MNKFVRTIKDGKYEDYTPHDLIYNNINKFRGWKCSAGSEGLFIDWDGNVWPATCEVGRKQNLLGSLKDDIPIKLLENYITCAYEYCPCHLEIYLPKFKNDKNQLNEIQPGNVTLNDFDAISRASEFDKVRKYIMWAFGRKCNFSCSYCDDHSHSKLDSDLVNEKSIKKALEYADRFRDGKLLIWNFTGGEPTINPLFLDLVKTLYDKGDHITIATNGSASKEYYTELAKYANINISVHFEFLKPEKLRRVAEAVLSLNPEWFGINFMVMPGKAHLTYSYASLLSEIPDFKNKTKVNFDILRKKNTAIYELYSDDDMKLINKLKSGDY